MSKRIKAIQNNLKRYFISASIFFNLTALLLLVGCGNTTSNNPVIFKTSLALQNSLGQQSSAFTNGENITFILSVQNLTGIPQVIHLSSSQQYDFLVFHNGTGTVLWKWSNDKMFLAVLTQLQFNPNETKTFSVVWNQKNNSGNLVGSGVFEGQGIIPSKDFSPAELSSPLVSFTIQ